VGRAFLSLWKEGKGDHLLDTYLTELESTVVRRGKDAMPIDVHDLPSVESIKNRNGAYCPSGK
jgi:hypothetical protein